MHLKANFVTNKKSRTSNQSPRIVLVQQVALALTCYTAQKPKSSATCMICCKKCLLKCQLSIALVIDQIRKKNRYLAQRNFKRIRKLALVLKE